MDNPKVLFVNQEISPYLKDSHISLLSRSLSQGIQEMGKEVRTFMPRFGLINERRNQLHEVIRLSGMNLVINDTDHPLIIKVASIQAARMQIYFIDNEDYFHKKIMFHDRNGKFADDNDEKAIFFSRGVIETIKKLSWSPDIIHCNGWFSCLTPLYIKRMYKDNPLFANTKVVLSLYGDNFKGNLHSNFSKKLKFDNITPAEIAKYGDFAHEDLLKMAIDFSDGIIMGDEEDNINATLIKHAKKTGKPILPYQGPDNYIEAFDNFYDKILLN
ncbi:MAG: glycogen/starch synthase [Bacteroidales bacterium]